MKQIIQSHMTCVKHSSGSRISMNDNYYWVIVTHCQSNKTIIQMTTFANKLSNIYSKHTYDTFLTECQKIEKTSKSD